MRRTRLHWSNLVAASFVQDGDAGICVFEASTTNENLEQIKI